MAFTKPSFTSDQGKVEVSDQRKLMCGAHNCPNRWTVAPQQLCSAHAWANPKDWPRITDDQHKLKAQGQNKAEPAPRRVDEQDIQRARNAFKAFIAGNQQDPKAWARRLKQKEEAGEKLTDVQRKMWRAALNER